MVLTEGCKKGSFENAGFPNGPTLVPRRAALILGLVGDQLRIWPPFPNTRPGVRDLGLGMCVEQCVSSWMRILGGRRPTTSP